MELLITLIVWIVLFALAYYLLDWSLKLIPLDIKFINLIKGLLLLALFVLIVWTIWGGYTIPGLRLDGPRR